MVNTGLIPVPPEKGGSIELHTYYLANELAKLGNEIHYVTSTNPNAVFDERVILHELPRIQFNFHGSSIQMLLGLGIGGICAFFRALAAICSDNYDIVHIHGHATAFCLLPLKKKSVFVFTAHNPNPWMVQSFSSLKQGFRRWAFKLIEGKIIRNVACVITVGETLKKEIIQRFNVSPGKIKVIPNGVDTNVFRPNMDHCDEVLAKYGLHQGYVLFVGRFVEQKGLHYFLRAIKGAKVNVVIVGGGSLESDLRKLCRQLGIVDQVRFIGSVPLSDLRRIFSAARLFVLPSVAEGFPGGLVTLEAMASGLPIVASNIGGITDVVEDGYNGFLFRVGDVDGMRNAITKLAQDKSLAESMGRLSREIVEKRFSWTSIAKKTLAVYEELLNKH
jgi:glycosyltransferase involved in cell wall biosynthesis